MPNEQEAAIIRRVQVFCASLADDQKEGDNWTSDDAVAVARMFNEAPRPFDLFTFVDEKPGHFTVGYQTDDGREWFHILRQMRNQSGSGLLETMLGPFDNHTADGQPIVQPEGA